MKIFVTGATGFIGHHLIERLSETPHEVVCLVRATSNIELLKSFRVKFIIGDVNNHEAVLKGMLGCDIVIHLANVYSMWLPDPEEYGQVNIEGTRTIMECALEAQIKKVVYVSTVAVYGKPTDDPFTEDSLPGPKYFSRYGRTKAEADQIAWNLFEQKDLPLVTLYPGIVLGAGDHKSSGQYINDIIHNRVPSTIFHSSKAVYVYVGDVTEAILKAAEDNHSIGKRYLIGKECLDGKTFARLIGEIAGVRLPFLHFPAPVVMAVSYFLTGLAEIIKKPPLWGLSIDAGWTLWKGFHFDGTRAERELGIVYTPVRYALMEAIASYRKADGSNAFTPVESS